jgi:hypothetical protein
MHGHTNIKLFSLFTLPIKYNREQVTGYMNDIFGMVSAYEDVGFWKISVLLLVSKKYAVKTAKSVHVKTSNFNVLLTVLSSTILIINQLNAQIFVL